MKHFLSAICLFLIISIQAAVPNWKIIPNASSITFTATQNDAPVSGQFKEFTGVIAFDPKQLSSSHVRIVVDTNSIETSYSEVQDTLKMGDWLDVRVFPEAIFTAKRFKKTGENTYEAEGTLSIRDKTMPLSVPFKLEQYSPLKTRVRGTVTVKRNEFGVGQGEWKKTEVVKDEVKVDFVLEAEAKAQ